MKRKVKWNILLFLVLAVLLTAGISYLGLSQNLSKEKTTPDKKDTHKMSIAFVNEDQGAMLSGKKYTFGDDIQTSVLKDTTHDWATVSRGVAESGLKRDVYNLMIIIPDNFSEKALSLTSTSPEKIQVNYKINDVGNNDLKVEAEKTASNLVADINQRVIDVYFASILTNLQEAQDNISTLVAKEKKHTSRYDSAVKDPLSNYTDQFGTVQSYTGSSKESFSGFEELLKNQESSLADASKENAAYQESLNSLVAMQEKNAPFGTTFTDNLQKYSASISADSVQGQLAALEQANAVLYAELQTMQDSNSLMSQTQALQNYIQDVNSRITDLDNQLNTTIQADIQEDIQKELAQILSGSAGGESKNYTIQELRNDINNRFKSKLEEEIKGLQYFTPEDAAILGIDTDEYNNIKALAAKFMSENADDFSDTELNQTVTDLTITKPVEDTYRAIQQRLATEGIPVSSQTFSLPATTKNTEIKINHEDTFRLDNIQVFKIVDGVRQEVSYRKKLDLKDDETTLTFSQEDEAGDYEVTFTAFLKTPVPEGFRMFGTFDVSMMAIQYTDQNVAVTDSGLTLNKTFIQKVTPIKMNEQSSYYTEEDLTEDVTKMFKEFQKISQSYDHTATLFQVYYGLDPLDVGFNLDGKSLAEQATDDSYYAIFNRDNLLDSIAAMASGNVTKAYKESLASFEAQIAAYKETMAEVETRSKDVAERLVHTSSEAASQNENLTKMLEEMATWQETSQALLEENQVIMSNGSDANSAITSINGDFSGLLTRSQSLAEATSSNLESADGVYKTFDSLDQEAKNIKSSGEDLISDAGTLSKDLAKKLTADETFSDNFSDVMSNSRVGDRQNESLYNFLSSPVEKVNGKTIAAGDKATPYYMVLIMTLIALFTSHVISSQEKKRMQRDAFSEELSIASKNLPVTFLTACVAIVEGLIIGVISGNIFDAQQIGLFLWIGICIILMLVLVMGFTYLLRQLQMLGMFIILFLVGTYLFLTDAVGLNVDRTSLFGTLQKYSPLQYIELLLNRILNGENNFLVLMYIFIGAAAVFVVLNLFVVRKTTPESEEVAHEDM
ncbi:type VII secretion protein EsaA [Listeria sp. ILCC797]|uniref:type VII secretion protein EsaA n=1 Tax=Listeria sp. ILCC797 TaxID=1918333 RepID=UPI000B590612|nr:type VII secretion protein EsaA [Listeria sp. ILCC797]